MGLNFRITKLTFGYVR